MASSDFSTGKTIVVIAIVVGCFAILWPKIFYPMMQAAFSMTSPKTDSEDKSFRPRDRPPHLAPERMPHLHEGGQVDKAFIKEGRPFPHPSSRQPVKPQAKTGGAMSIIMPIYTIGIVVFFLYTVLKLVFKKSPDVDKKPLIKDFHMDPDYHKFVCQQPQKDKAKPAAKPKATASEPAKPKPPADCNEANEDYEIYKLRKKLEETETAMQRIMKHMGAVSECLSNACLLKDCSAAGAENKNIALETLLPESLTEPFKKKMSSEQEDESTCKNRKQNKAASSDETTTNISDLDSNAPPNHDAVIDESCKNCDCSENTSQKELKRDSSINSETSSFELLSQSLLNNSNKAVDGNTSDSDDDEDSKECNDELSEKSTSSEAMDDVLDDNDDDDDDDDNNDDVEPTDYALTNGNKQDPIKKSHSEPLKEKMQSGSNH